MKQIKYRQITCTCNQCTYPVIPLCFDNNVHGLRLCLLDFDGGKFVGDDEVCVGRKCV